jgi:hypothetical protein
MREEWMEGKEKKGFCRRQRVGRGREGGCQGHGLKSVLWMTCCRQSFEASKLPSLEKRERATNPVNRRRLVIASSDSRIGYCKRDT